MTPEPPPQDEPDPKAKRPGALTWVLLLLVGVFVAVALVRNWEAVGEDLLLLSWSDLLWSGLAAAAAALFTFVSWRIMLDDLGHPMQTHSALTMFFTGQLGKYIPGSVWTAAIQAQMGRQWGLRRSIIVMAYAVTLILSVVTGAAIGALALLGAAGRDNLPILGLVVVGAVVVMIPVLRPAIANRALAWLARKTGRDVPSLDLSGRALVGAVLAGAAAWVLLGVHVWLIARPMGAGLADLPAVIGAFSLAFVAGLIVVPLPAGAGIREGVLTATLAPVIGGPSALTVSIVSRAILLVVDVLLAAGVGLPWAIGRRRAKARS